LVIVGQPDNEQEISKHKGGNTILFPLFYFQNGHFMKFIFQKISEIQKLNVSLQPL